eukprot:363690-Chlamydomonas_euryale.AAC.7
MPRVRPARARVCGWHARAPSPFTAEWTNLPHTRDHTKHTTLDPATGRSLSRSLDKRFQPTRARDGGGGGGGAARAISALTSCLHAREVGAAAATAGRTTACLRGGGAVWRRSPAVAHNTSAAATGTVAAKTAESTAVSIRSASAFSGLWVGGCSAATAAVLGGWA